MNNSDKRIFFVGSHSTGKTSLAVQLRFLLRGKNFNLGLITEVTRDCFPKGVTYTDCKRNIDTANMIQLDVARRQEKVEEEGQFCIFDRGIDHNVYAALNSTTSASPSKEQICRMKEGLTFFVRPQKCLLHTDSLRDSADWDEIMQIDGAIKMLLREHDIPYISIDTPNWTDRLATVLTASLLYLR